MAIAKSTRTTDIATIDHHGEPLKVRATYGWVLLEGNDSPYFTLTGEGWLKGDRRDDPSMCGQMHDEILQAFPWLKLISHLHLRDAITGIPLHALENSWYWFSADKTTRSGYPVHFPTGWADMSRAQRAASYLGCDPSIFKDVTTKEEFTAAWQQLVDTGVYAELAHWAITLYGLKDPRPSPICDRHGGAWGEDETCEQCTDEEGVPRAAH